MGSPHFSGNNDGYHEALATGREDTPPLVPEAATAADPFLLDAAGNNAELQQLMRTQRKMLQISGVLYQQLFPHR